MLHYRLRLWDPVRVRYPRQLAPINSLPRLLKNLAILNGAAFAWALFFDVAIRGIGGPLSDDDLSGVLGHVAGFQPFGEEVLFRALPTLILGNLGLAGGSATWAIGHQFWFPGASVWRLGNDLLLSAFYLKLWRMPASGYLNLLGAVAADGGVQTDETTAANNATANDITLMAPDVKVNDAFYFMLDTPARILRLNTGQAGVGTWAVAWEYPTTTAATSYAALASVTDNTSAFTVSGSQTVSWGVPTDWSTSTVNGITGYPVRARVTSVTATTTQPLGTQAAYETGQWWVLIDDLPGSAGTDLSLYLGGPDMATSHPMFIGPHGITTSDAAALELGRASTLWEIEIVGYIDTENTTGTAAEAWILNKSQAVRIYVSGNNEITAQINEGQTITATSVASGLHTLRLFHPISTSQNEFYIDGTLIGTSTEVAMTDAPSTWEWGLNGTVTYFDSVKVRRRLATEVVLRPGSTSKDVYVHEGNPNINFSVFDFVVLRVEGGSGRRTLILSG